MKKITGLLALLACSLGLYAGTTHEGVVMDTINGGGYTYVQIKDSTHDYWIAVNELSIPKGTEVRFTEELIAKNFKSKALNRTFDEVMFASNLQHKNSVTDTANPALIQAHVKESPYKQNDTMSIKDAWEKRISLNGQTIKVRGKVVKISPNIMSRNWIHIQDGTGVGSEVSDIVFTSKERPNVGDIVTASGVVSTDKDFGAGYFYKIIVENATFSN